MYSYFLIIATCYHDHDLKFMYNKMVLAQMVEHLLRYVLSTKVLLYRTLKAYKLDNHGNYSILSNYFHLYIDSDFSLIM